MYEYFDNYFAGFWNIVSWHGKRLFLHICKKQGTIHSILGIVLALLFLQSAPLNFRQ